MAYALACVARPVGKAEIKAQPKAQEAFQKEWDRLKEKGTWRTGPNDGVRARRDVAREARAEGREVHLGMLYALCVEKGSELAPELRKFKATGRVPWRPGQESKLGSDDVPRPRLQCRDNGGR